MSLLQIYQNYLQKSPKITNALTTGSLFGTGDVIAQLLFPAATATADASKRQKFQPDRTIRSIIYGSLVFSFVGDRWYKILSKISFPGTPLQNLKLNHLRNSFTKMSIDQLGFAPIGIPLYFSVMSILEKKSPEETWSKLKKNWWPTLQANWMVWPAFQVINLGLVPVQHQLLAVNVFSIAWNTYLSMRNSTKHEDNIVYYPPIPE